MTYQFTILFIIGGNQYTAVWNVHEETRHDALKKLIRDLRSLKGVDNFEVIG